MYKKITPNMMVTDVNATIKYYQENLCFEILMGVDEHKETIMGKPAIEKKLVWAMIKKDDIEIMFQERENFIEELPQLKDINIGGTFSLFFSIQNVNELYNNIKNNVEVIKDIHKTFYGSDEFVIKDLNGYCIYIAEAQNG